MELRREPGRSSHSVWFCKARHEVLAAAGVSSPLMCLGQHSCSSVFPQLLNPEGSGDAEQCRRQEEASLRPHSHHRECAVGTCHTERDRETLRGSHSSCTQCLGITRGDPGWLWSRPDHREPRGAPVLNAEKNLTPVHTSHIRARPKWQQDRPLSWKALREIRHGQTLRPAGPRAEGQERKLHAGCQPSFHGPASQVQALQGELGIESSCWRSHS